jgi:pimeloyl-ACP methyl ester carboxylesterase
MSAGPLSPNDDPLRDTPVGARSERPMNRGRLASHAEDKRDRTELLMSDGATDRRAPTPTARANGVELGIESFGRDDDPLMVLVGGPTMLSWPDSLCERLASGGRRVVRYDLRDCGASTTLDPEAPAYSLRDLAADAAALVGALGAATAHLGGVGVGGMVAQVAALDHPKAFSALTLVSTRPVAPGPVDDDLPDHDTATMGMLFSRPSPDWTNRAAVAAFIAEGAELLGNDPKQALSIAARIWDRTPSSRPAAHQANQLGMVFTRLDCTPRWRERLGELTLPTLVVHGAADPFFPVGNGEVLAAEIPNARLLVLDDMGSALRNAGAEEVAAAMLTL